MIEWTTREPPLPPAALVVMGDAARLLALKLAANERLEASGLTGATCGDSLIIMGPGDALPWVDGVWYLGQPPAAPALRLPTQLKPNCPDTVLATAVRRDASGPAPWAVYGSPLQVVSLANAGALDPARLRAWAARD